VKLFDLGNLKKAGLRFEGFTLVKIEDLGCGFDTVQLECQ
jgi:hypothetical protein